MSNNRMVPIEEWVCPNCGSKQLPVCVQKRNTMHTTLYNDEGSLVLGSEVVGCYPTHVYLKCPQCLGNTEVVVDHSRGTLPEGYYTYDLKDIVFRERTSEDDDEW